MTAAPAKFRFDLDLGHRDERNAVMTESALAAMVSTARAEGYGDGLAEGQRAAVVRAAERLAQAAERLADHAAAINAAIDDHRQATVQDAVGLAVTIGRKLAGALVAAQPTVEIEALITRGSTERLELGLGTTVVALLKAGWVQLLGDADEVEAGSNCLKATVEEVLADQGGPSEVRLALGNGQTLCAFAEVDWLAQRKVGQGCGVRVQFHPSHVLLGVKLSLRLVSPALIVALRRSVRSVVVPPQPLLPGSLPTWPKLSTTVPL